MSESQHYNTCTHRMDGVVLIKDAEQAAVFHDPVKNVYHYSIRVKDWYSCKVVPASLYDQYQLYPHQELAFIQSEARFLESLHQ